MQCVNCGKNLHKGLKYCSNKCDSYFKRSEKIARWLEGTLEGFTTSRDYRSFVKYYLITTFGEKCSICGWDEINPYSRKVPVEVDHIDGNSKNTVPNNVRLLCPNCHSLTSTYRNLNKGKGRFSRLKRYNEGKSY